MNRPRSPGARTALWPLLAIALVLPVQSIAHPSSFDDAQVPLTVQAVTRALADVSKGGTPLCEVDGTLLAVHPDPAPSGSGISGVVVVSGLPFVVPTSVPVQVGDTPGDEIPFLDLLATPMGFPSFVGRGASVSGTFEITSTGGTHHLRCVADSFIVEVGHPPLIGIVTSNGPGGLYVMGVRVVPYADPRIAPFVRIQDLAGHPLDISELPEGATVIAHGDHNEARDRLDMIFIELDDLIPSAPGEPDHLSILRVEARSARFELRARGFTNNADALVSLYDHSAGTKGAMLASDIPVDPADGRWDVRVDFRPVATTPDGIPTRVLAETTGGGVATAEVNIR